MIKELDEAKIPEDQIIKIVMYVYGVDEITASFIIGIERGTIQSDVIILDPGEKPATKEER